jgi:hypothetical protein
VCDPLSLHSNLSAAVHFLKKICQVKNFISKLEPDQERKHLQILWNVDFIRSGNIMELQ